MSYSRENPFLSSLKVRENLCKPGSDKNTHHLVLDISCSGLTYEVGDCIAVQPDNDPLIVESILDSLSIQKNCPVLDKKTGEPTTAEQFLLKKANLSTVSKKLFTEVVNQTNLSSYQELLKEENKQKLKEYLEAREIWDFLMEHKGIKLDPQLFVNTLMPMMPRFYSIASSMHAVQDEVHLTVVHLEYSSNGYQRKGVCTDYLLNRVKLGESVIPIYLQPHKGFTLPADHDVPIIMVGPGTGVAPFRGFMQERIQKNACGSNWLFFGERNRSHHYFYENFWTELQQNGKLRLDVAFSRDQQHKVYVQHKMLENGAELFHWLKNGAYFYVCGDAKRMAKDVEATLQQVVAEHGKLSEAEARDYLKQLRAEKRYLRDVY